jgi:hypothetical protein
MLRGGHEFLLPGDLVPDTARTGTRSTGDSLHKARAHHEMSVTRVRGSHGSGRLRGITRRALADPGVARAILVVGALGGAAWLGPRASDRLALAVVGTILALVLLRWPVLGVPGLLLVGALIPLEISTGTESKINVAIIGVGVLTGLWVFSMVASRAIRLRSSAPNAPWLALIAIAGISILAGQAFWNPWVVTKSTFTLVQLAQWAVFTLSACAFFLGANQMRSRKELRVLVALFIVLGGIWFLAMLVPHGSVVASRMFYSGVVFRVWVVSLAGGLGLFHGGLSWRWRAVLIGMAVGIVTVSYFDGRSWQSGWLPPMVAFSTLLAVRAGRGFTRLALVSAVPGVAIFTSIVLPVVARQEAWSFDTRLIAWRGLFSLLEGRWLLGLGLGAYWHYWRGIMGSMTFLDPATGYMHFTMDPKVNMHNNYMDILGQMGVLGVIALVWLIVALYRLTRRTYALEPHGFGQAYIAACAGGLTGMLFAGMLGDWFFPFVYNVGLPGFRDSYLGWLFLGGLVLLDHTRAEAKLDVPNTAQDASP